MFESHVRVLTMMPSSGSGKPHQVLQFIPFLITRAVASAFIRNAEWCHFYQPH